MYTDRPYLFPIDHNHTDSHSRSNWAFVSELRTLCQKENIEYCDNFLVILAFFLLLVIRQLDVKIIICLDQVNVGPKSARQIAEERTRWRSGRELDVLWEWFLCLRVTLWV